MIVAKVEIYDYKGKTFTFNVSDNCAEDARKGLCNIPWATAEWVTKDWPCDRINGGLCGRHDKERLP